jgi:large subunit ribosomal protein L31e
VKVIRTFAMKQMKTKEVRLDPTLNKAIWDKGAKNVPHRIRVRLSRKRNDAEEAKEKMYTYVEHVAVSSFKGK